MQLKILPRRILLIIVFLELVIALTLVLLYYIIPKNSVDSNLVLPSENVAVPPKTEQPGFGLPLRLKIPVIGVDAAVEYVGLTAGGAMDVPKNPDGVAWFNLTPHPGNSGSVVIAGHYGIWENGKEAVFNNLKKLVKGDKLSVIDDKGATISFVVRESQRYQPEADASGVFSSNDGKSHLNLITCESWDKVSESFATRLVVFTDKE